MSWWEDFVNWFRQGVRRSRDTEGRSGGRPLSPDQEAALARRALYEQENPRAAKRHAANALSHDPANSDYLALLDEVIEATDDPLALFDQAPGRYFSDVAAEAYVRQRLGEYDTALQLIVQVAQARPDVPYLEAWGMEWLDSPAVLAQIRAETFDYFMAGMVSRFSENAFRNATSRRKLAAVLDLFLRFLNAREPGPMTRYWYSATLRKLGRYDDALAVGRDMQLVPREAVYGHLCVAFVLRERGHLDEAAAEMEHAANLGTHYFVRNDLGDLYLQHFHDLETAREWYREAQRLEPRDPWSKASLLYIRYRQTGEDQWLEQLFRAAREGNRRAHELMKRLMPFDGFLPEPADLASQALRHILEYWDKEKPDDSESVDAPASADPNSDSTANSTRDAEPIAAELVAEGDAEADPSDEERMREGLAALLDESPLEPSLRDLFADDEGLHAETRDNVIRVALSHLEPPSVHLAYRLEAAAQKRETELRIRAQSVPSPDPRAALGPVEWLLWEYDEDSNSAVAAMEPPAEDVVAAVAELARAPFDWESNWNQAAVIAERLGQDRVRDVVAVLTYPPPLPEGERALVWLPRVQLAALQIVARMEEEWVGSQRRRVLLDVALGPRDWATTAAILVLRQLAAHEESARQDVQQTLIKLFNNRPDEGDCTYMGALLWSLATLPGLDPRMRYEFENLYGQWIQSER